MIRKFSIVIKIFCLLLFVSDKAFANENLTRVDKLTKNLRCLI